MRATSERATSEAERLPRAARACLLAALLAGGVLRVAGVARQALAGDEPLAAPTILAGYRAVLTTYDGRGSHPGFSLLQRVSLDLCGTSVLAYRLPSIAAGLAALVLLPLLGRRFVGRGPAWLAGVLLALSSMHVYHSRSARAYALLALALLLLVAAARAALAGVRPAWWAVAALVALLPWFHLSALAPVLALAAACLVARRGEGGRAGWIAFGAGLVACALLWAPARAGFARYLSDCARERDFRGEWGSTLAALGGTLPGGLWFLGGGLLGALLLARRAPREALLLGAPIAAVPLAILVVRPRGGDLAMARYLVVALAPMLLASSFALFEFVRLARARVGVAYLAGLAFALLQLARGPLEPSWFRGTLANAPELVLATAARVAAPARAPELYARLAAAPHTLTVVEYPTPAFALPMLRSYESFHGQRVLVGLDASAREWCGSAPYISIWDRDALAARADWLILHVDPAAEVQDWLARAHAPRAPPAAEDLGAVRGALCARLGAPDYDDGRVVAWRFARS